MPSSLPVRITIRDVDGNFIEVDADAPLPTTLGTANIDTNLHDGTGTPITSTGGSIDVNLTGGSLALSESTDSIAVFGNDGTDNQALLTDSDGVLQVAVPSTTSLSTNDFKLDAQLKELLIQVKITNEYLSLMTDEVITELDISEAIQ
jgi:hypothetical protein